MAYTRISKPSVVFFGQRRNREALFDQGPTRLRLCTGSEVFDPLASFPGHERSRCQILCLESESSTCHSNIPSWACDSSQGWNWIICHHSAQCKSLEQIRPLPISN